MTKTEIVLAITNADITCPELKTAANNYLEAIGTVKENECAKALIAEAEEDLMTNDEVIKFFSSEKGIKILGKEKAEYLYIHHKNLIADGVEFCDCPACVAAKRLIDNKDMFLR